MPDYTKGTKGILDRVLSAIEGGVLSAEQFAAHHLPAAAGPALKYVRYAGNVAIPAGLGYGVGKAYHGVYLSDDPYADLPPEVRAKAEAFDSRVAAHLASCFKEKRASVPLETVQDNLNPGIRRMIAAPALAYVSYMLAKDLFNHRKRQKALETGEYDGGALETNYRIE